MIVPFDPASIEGIAARLDLRDPNRRALTAVAEALDAGEPGLEIVCDLATATGKTYIAAAVIDYLAAAGIRNLLFVCPGTTILNKTVTNFTPGHAKFVDGMEVRPTVITSEDFQRGSVSEALRTSDDFKLFVFNVQQLLRPTANTSRRVWDYDEHLGSSRQMLDTVEVLSHRKFRDLLNDAGTLLEAFFTDRHPAQLVAPDSTGTLDGEAALAAGAESGRLDVFVRPTEGVDASGEPVEGGLFGAAVEDIERRIAEAEQQSLALSTTMDLVAGASRVRFPRLAPRLVPQPFSLSTVPNQAATDLGGQFATDSAPTLDRQALTASRVDNEAGQGIRVEASVAEDPVEASQLALPLEALRDRIRREVLHSRFVESTRHESNAINRLVGEFLGGAGVTDDLSGTWTEAKVRNAVGSFLALVRRYHSQRGTSLQTQVELVEYPPSGIVSPDEVFLLNSAWAAHRWYRGWTKSVLPAARFDAKSTEFTLAQLFESSTPEVSWWLRVESHQDVWIPWGNRKRHYPDFIVITGDGHHWMVEGKADDRANDPEVMAKKAAGFEWARFANDSGDAPDTWHYLFATETAIRQAGGTWAGLKNFAEWE